MDKYLFRRYALMAVALLILALGIAVITRALLGTSPVTCTTLVLSMLTSLSMGQWTILFNFMLVLLELPLLTRSQMRTDCRIILLQIPVSLIFGCFIDLGMYLSAWLIPTTYLLQLLCLAVGCFVLAIGISLEVKANVAMASCDYFITVVSHRFHTDYGYTKLGVDITLVTTAAVLSMLYLNHLAGVREGTLIAAIVVGPIIHFVSPCFNVLNSWLGLEK